MHIQPPEVALFLCRLITLQHSICTFDLCLGASKNVHTLQNVFQEMRLYDSFLIDILLVFFLSKTVKQALNGFLRFETSTFVYRFLVCVFKIVASATSGHRIQSLPQSLNLPAFKKKWEAKRKGVCCAKNEKTGEEQCNNVNKIGINERREHRKMKDKTFI